LTPPSRVVAEANQTAQATSGPVFAAARSTNLREIS